MKELSEKEALRAIPPINEILGENIIIDLVSRHGRAVVLDYTRGVVELMKKAIRQDASFCVKQDIQSEEDIKDYINRNLVKMMKSYEMRGLKKVINATGIILHTNLGRAPLPKKAIESMVEVSNGYSNLEYDLQKGKRGSRHSHLETMISKITGAEDGIIVNNNAAAVFLCLNTFANQKEVVISRGQQVEIGGSFRIPDIIARSGAKMVEVGTTNKTYLSDYDNVISEETAVLLKVHTSNYKVVGFTHDVPLKEMVKLGNGNELITIEDLGSGCLMDLSTFGIPYEPMVQDSVKDGADLVTFSGDKLLGGPQAGIIVGKKKWINQLKKNPLFRMLRCDKVTIAGLRAVFELYLDSEQAIYNIPTISMISLNEDELQLRAIKLQECILYELHNCCKTKIIDEWDEIGGGSLPGIKLKSRVVVLTPSKISIDDLQSKLRKAKIPVICRINQGKLYFHVRTIQEEEIELIVESLKEVLGDCV